MGKRKGKQKPRARRKANATRDHLLILARVPQAAAAWVLGVSGRTLRDAVDAPRLPDGYYDLRTLLAWWIEREKRKQPAGPSPAKERILAAQAASLERKNAIEIGKLIDLESTAHTVRWILTSYMARLQAIKDDSEPQLAGELQAAIDDVRQKFEQAFPAIAKDEEVEFPLIFPGGGHAAAH